MGDVVKFKKPSLKQKAKGKTLCTHGFHKWVVCNAQHFDVKQGKLVTLYVCKRCNKQRVTLH